MYKTQFGKDAVDGDYVAKAYIDKVSYGRSSFQKPIIHIGKIHKGFAYFPDKGEAFAESKSLDLICVVAPEEVSNSDKKRIEEYIEKCLEKTSKERYFQIIVLDKDTNTTRSYYTFTSKLPLDAPIQDVRGFLNKVLTEKCIRAYAFDYQEIVDAAEFMRKVRAQDQAIDSLNIEIEI